MNVSAVVTGTVIAVAPIVGAVLNVTPSSVQPDCTAATSTAPATLMRFTNSVRFARVTCAAIVPDGRFDKSYCRNATEPLPTYRLLTNPKFTVGNEATTCASATNCTVFARAGTASIKAKQRATS